MNTTTKYDAEIESISAWFEYGAKLVEEIKAAEGYSSRYSTALYAVQRLSRRRVQLQAARAESRGLRS